MSEVVQPTALVGEWDLTRQVHDEQAGLSGTAFGKLTLAAEGDQIVWREQGTLLWNGSQLRFSRSYRLRRGDDGWWLDFADGRPFHAWRPGHPVHHPCGPDHYQGLIVIDGPDEWHTLWDLRGPDTTQRISTRLTRLRATRVVPAVG
jgi:hypothetical protein